MQESKRSNLILPGNHKEEETVLLSEPAGQFSHLFFQVFNPCLVEDLCGQQFFI